MGKTSTHPTPKYPPDWYSIAYQIKQDNHWTCQSCETIQGEDPCNNITVHHKDHNTFNNNPSNLIILCQKCHLRLEGFYQQISHARNLILQSLSDGQLILPGFERLILPKINILSYKSPALSQEPGL